MIQILLTFLILVFATCNVSARRGYVRTRDGHVLEGHLRFDSNEVIVVDAGKELWARVSVTNLASMGFEAVVEPEELTPLHSDLPGPWRIEDVGSMSEPGTVEYNRGVLRASSMGTNVLGDGDSFLFIHKPVSGESELVARLLYIQSTDPWARAGVMMRAGLGADARHVFLAITASRGGSLATREHRGSETSITMDRGGGSWIKLKRDGEVITAFRSVDGRRWRAVDKIPWPIEEGFSAGVGIVGGSEGVRTEVKFDNMEEGASLRNRNYVPEIELKSGSVLAGYIEQMDDTSIHFDPTEHRTPASTHSVALIRFQPVPSKMARMVMTASAGVLLVTGEFIEGECGGILNHRVQVNSVPLGLKRYDVNNEVVAIVLGKRALAPARVFEVRTTDGTTWLGLSLTLDADGILLREPLLGARRIPLHEIVELRRVS